mmetsp:Transcript_1997/g.5829  ORF Transcript_1997/g.5829 Transcript_1997/m.5829 type:complete len:375 (-) Transcript_1997:28-1152(-)
MVHRTEALWHEPLVRRLLQEQNVLPRVLFELICILGAVQGIYGEFRPTTYDDAALPGSPEGPHSELRHVPGTEDQHRAPADVDGSRPRLQELDAGLVLGPRREEGAALPHELLLLLLADLPAAGDLHAGLGPVARCPPPRGAVAAELRHGPLLDVEELLPHGVRALADPRLEPLLLPLRLPPLQLVGLALDSHHVPVYDRHVGVDLHILRGSDWVIRVGGDSVRLIHHQNNGHLRVQLVVLPDRPRYQRVVHDDVRGELGHLVVEPLVVVGDVDVLRVVGVQLRRRNPKELTRLRRYLDPLRLHEVREVLRYRPCLDAELHRGLHVARVPEYLDREPGLFQPEGERERRLEVAARALAAHGDLLAHLVTDPPAT